MSELRTDPLAEEALSGLLDRVRPKFRRILIRARIPPEDAEDLVQETLVLLLTRGEEIRRPEAWLVASLKYRCLMYWRDRKKRLCLAIDDALQESLVERSAPTDEQAALAHDVSKLLPKLPEHCRPLLHLRYTLGYRPREAADQLGYRRSSIWNVTKRCLTALTRQLVSAGYAG